MHLSPQQAVMLNNVLTDAAAIIQTAYTNGADNAHLEVKEQEVWVIVMAGDGEALQAAAPHLKFVEFNTDQPVPSYVTTLPFEAYQEAAPNGHAKH